MNTRVKISRNALVAVVNKYQKGPESISHTPAKVPQMKDQYGGIFTKCFYPKSVEIDLLVKALGKISPDDKRGDGTFKDGASWLATVLAGASIGEVAREPLRQWSMQSDKYDQKDFDTTFNSYNPSKVGRNGGPLTVASLHSYVNSLKNRPNVYLGDIGNAIRLADLYRGSMLFVRDSSLVLNYDSVIGWVRGNAEDPYRAAQALVRAMSEEAAKNFADNPSDSNALKQLTEVRRASKKPAIDAMIALAKAEDGMSVDMAECDADSYLIGVQNGVVDLKSGQLLPPDPGRLVTKRVNVHFDPEAECPLYEKFLREAVPDGAEREFLIRFSGYCLSGEVSEQVLLFLLGTGANGKTVWIETMKAILGDYADKIQTEMLMQHFRNTQAASPDLVQLQGRRFIYANETTEGRFLDDARVKDLTGGDTITGRLPYAKAAISFEPTHKLVIAGNHAPIVTDDSDGLWRRMILLKFTQKFEGKDRDPDLPAKLRTESAGIFNLWLKGFADWYKRSLMIPDSLLRATNGYRNEQDLLEQFIKEECVVGPDESCTNQTLKHRYFAWCEDNNSKALSGHRFSRKLTERGFRIDDSKRTRQGISVRPYGSIFESF
jgi:putative DNA primase/helicase